MRTFPKVAVLGFGTMGGEAQGSAGSKSQTYVVWTAILASSMVFADGAIVTVAIPRMQAELDTIEVEGAAGGGMVTVTMTAKGALLGQLVRERARGRPLQYLLGTEYFGDLQIKCRPGVLIPR